MVTKREGGSKGAEGQAVPRFHSPGPACRSLSLRYTPFIGLAILFNDWRGAKNLVACWLGGKGRIDVVTAEPDIHSSACPPRFALPRKAVHCIRCGVVVAQTRRGRFVARETSSGGVIAAGGQSANRGTDRGTMPSNRRPPRPVRRGQW